MPPPTTDGIKPVPVLSSKEYAGSHPETMEELIAKLAPIYKDAIKPLEDMYKFEAFRPSWYEESMLNQRPFVTFLGPWSSGKTSFINYLLQSNYLLTGPQPTTSEFTVILHGKNAGPIDGPALVNAKDLPFRGLSQFGESFVNHVKGFQAPHPLLERVTLIDTPGVLENAKDAARERRYDYSAVCRWLVERSDVVYILFDPTKLDSGNELRQLFTQSVKGMESKVRIILNKADSLSTQELMRVYGSLFWNLSGLITTTEPPRVFVGSFWGRSYNPNAFSRLFSEEKADLLHELLEVVPQQAKDKKVAAMILRAKQVLVHGAIIGGIRQDLPLLFGKKKAKRRSVEELEKRYESIGSTYHLNPRDFPRVEAYAAFLDRFDVEKFPPFSKPEKAGRIRNIQRCIDTTLPQMLRPVDSMTAAHPSDWAEQNDLVQRYRDVPPAPQVSATPEEGASAAAVPQPIPAAPPSAPAQVGNMWMGTSSVPVTPTSAHGAVDEEEESEVDPPTLAVGPRFGTTTGSACRTEELVHADITKPGFGEPPNKGF